jgi:beta-glucanase (GH16 family)
LYDNSFFYLNIYIMKNLKTILVLCFALTAVFCKAQNPNHTILYNGQAFIRETTPVYVDSAHSAAARPGYTLIWQDEFEYGSPTGMLSGTTPKWNASQNSWAGHDITHPLDHLSTQTNDVGTRSLRVSIDRVNPVTWGTAMIVTRLKKQFIMGYFEARIKLSLGHGSWPAFWLFGNTAYAPCTPVEPAIAGSYTEIDIFENFPEREFAKNMTFNAHAYNFDCNGVLVPNANEYHLSTRPPVIPPLMTAFEYSGDKDFEEEYHLYGMDFKSDSVVFYLDGKRIGFTTEAAFIEKLRSNAMWLTLNNAMDFLKMDYTTPDHSHMDVDYVRVYKRNPVVSLMYNTCTSNSYTTLIQAQLPDVTLYPQPVSDTRITYSAVFTSGGVGGTITPSGAYFTIVRPNNAPFTVKVTARLAYNRNTSFNANEVEETYAYFKYPDNIFVNQFTVGSPVCTGGSIRVTATGVGALPGSIFHLWNVTPAGVITGAPLQWSPANSSSYTFINLTQGTTYAITRSGTNSCTPYSSVQKNFKVNLPAFTMSPVECGGPGIGPQVTCSANSTNTGGTFTWLLYPCDAAGNVPIGTNPVAKYTNPCTYTNLTRDSYYKIFLQMSGGCAGAWIESNQILYVPTLGLNPYYQTIQTAVSSLGGNYFRADAAGAVLGNDPGLGSSWIVYPADQYGNFTSNITIGPALFGAYSASWDGANYPFQDGNFYVFVHGVYGPCSIWNWHGKLVYREPRHAAPQVSDIELTESQIAQLNATLGATLPTMELMPNPANENVVIRYSGFEGAVSIEIYNLSGQVIAHFENVTGTEFQADLSTYTAGVYLVKISDGKKTMTEKLIRN